jgi:hypothetical protein
MTAGNRMPTATKTKCRRKAGSCLPRFIYAQPENIRPFLSYVPAMNPRSLTSYKFDAKCFQSERYKVFLFKP